MKLTGEEKEYLWQLMKDYLKKTPDTTPEEKAELKEWVKSGYSPYDNPDGVCDECCHLLDFISAMRSNPRKRNPTENHNDVLLLA